MKRIIAIIVFAICGFSIGAQTDMNKLEALVERFNSNQLFSGVVLVAKGDQVILELALGYANWYKEIEMQPNGRFNIGTMNQLLTALCIFQLHQKEVLSLNKDIKAYFDKSIIDLKESVTINQLLLYDSDITNEVSYRDEEFVYNADEIGRVAMIISESPDEETFGRTFKGVNPAFLILRRIIENVSGIAYEDYLDRFILITPKGGGPIVQPYKVLSKSHYKQLYMANPQSAVRLVGLMTDAHRLLNLSLAIQQNSLPDLSLRKEISLIKRDGEADLKRIVRQEFMRSRLGGENFIGHDGKAEGYSSDFRVNLSDSLTIIVLGNNSFFPATRLTEEIARFWYGKDFKWPEVSIHTRVARQLSFIKDPQLAASFKKRFKTFNYEIPSEPAILIETADLLVQVDHLEEATLVHRLNKALFPEQALAYNAEADFYEKVMADTARALILYEEVLARFVGNNHAEKQIERLTHQQPPLTRLQLVVLLTGMVIVLWVLFTRRKKRGEDEVAEL